MNKKRRIEISNNLHELVRIKDRIEFIKENFDSILFDEQDSYDNIPENLQNSDRAMDSEEAIEYIGEAISYIGDAIDNIDNAIDSIEEIS